MDSKIQKRLINWGYAVCDAAIRRHVDPSQSKPDNFPYPEKGVG
jgi:NTE family protein